MNTKIVKIENLVEIIKNLKSEGKTIVTTNGTYDIIHAGHIFSLQESKSLGDVLIVGLNSDSSVKKYKSIKRPIISEIYRAEVIAALECVDYVFIFDEINPITFINLLKPDIHTNSSDYGNNCIEKDAVISNGGKLHLLKKYNGISTTEIVNKIIQIYK